MMGIIIVIILCISIAALTLSSLSYVKSHKNSKMSSKILNQTDSNLVKIPLTRISGGGGVPTSYDLKSDGYHIFITQISNLKPNCSVTLSFNDLAANLPVDNNGIAYPGGKKEQPLMLSLMPYNEIKLTTQYNWENIPIGTFSSLKVTDVLPNKNSIKFQMSLVNLPQGGPSQTCNYNQSDIVTKTGMIQNGAFGFPVI